MGDQLIYSPGAYTEVITDQLIYSPGAYTEVFQGGRSAYLQSWGVHRGIFRVEDLLIYSPRAYTEVF